VIPLSGKQTAPPCPLGSTLPSMWDEADFESPDLAGRRNPFEMAVGLGPK